MATGFTLTIPKPKHTYENGNIHLYQLDEGWWQIEINPSNSTTLEGLVSKLSRRVEQQEQDEDTVMRALKGCFLQAQNIQFIETPTIRINWTPVMRRNVGFTLRGIDLANYANKNGVVSFNGRGFRITMGDVIQEHQVTCVYGLVSLISDGEISVADVAKVLKDLLGFHSLRFLFHTYNPQGWVDWFSWRGAI